MPPGNKSGPRRRSDERATDVHQGGRPVARYQSFRSTAEHAEAETYSQVVVFLGLVGASPDRWEQLRGPGWRDDHTPQTSACSACSAFDLKRLRRTYRLIPFWLAPCSSGSPPPRSFASLRG